MLRLILVLSFRRMKRERGEMDVVRQWYLLAQGANMTAK